MNTSKRGGGRQGRKKTIKRKKEKEKKRKIIFRIIPAVLISVLILTQYFWKGSQFKFNEVVSIIQYEQQVESKSTQILYSLHDQDELPYNDTFSPFYKCPLTSDRQSFDTNLTRKKGVLDFTTTIDTSLKIIVMGDSTGVQLGQGLQESAGSNASERDVLRFTSGRHEGIALSTSIRGGGAIALWRITGMFRKGGKKRPLPNSHGGGWSELDVIDLKNHTYLSNLKKERKIESFDVMIFNIPHGWIKWSDITIESFRETVELAGSQFGVETVIFITVPFSNNIKTRYHEKRRLECNEMLRLFSRCWQQLSYGDGNTSVRNVLVMENGVFVDKLIEENARNIGMDISNNNYKLERLKDIQSKWPHSIAHVCSDRVNNDGSCVKNSLTVDGKHMCLATVGARMFANIGCLLGCLHNNIGNDINAMEKNRVDKLQCSQMCNDQFMSLKPVHETMLKGEIDSSRPMQQNEMLLEKENTLKAVADTWSNNAMNLKNTTSCHAALTEVSTNWNQYHTPENFCSSCEFIQGITCLKKAQYYIHQYDDEPKVAFAAVMEQNVACKK